ncbi:hypothetical protein AU476_29975 [Cupriavidus sp. UYMSc13B]|nr:hypothetical protein AU476_29975 [Cupriavidus sp. UYMSc13B]
MTKSRVRLTYSAESGWPVATALPRQCRYRRRRLLGEPEGGARSWIYREGGGAFVARCAMDEFRPWASRPEQLWDYGLPTLSPGMRLPDHGLMAVNSNNIRCTGDNFRM